MLTSKRLKAFPDTFQKTKPIKIHQAISQPVPQTSPNLETGTGERRTSQLAWEKWKKNGPSAASAGVICFPLARGEPAVSRTVSKVCGSLWAVVIPAARTCVNGLRENPQTSRKKLPQRLVYLPGELYLPRELYHPREIYLLRELYLPRSPK